MLILVSVTVSVVINSNLIGVAQNAADRTQIAYDEEADVIDNILKDMGIVDWEKAKAEAVAPASQDEERNNGVLGIGTNGEPVDMDLWLYALDNKTGGYGLNSAEVLNNEENGGTNTSKITMAGYVGSISDDGEIEGKIPAYIKKDDGDWVAVTSLYKTFQANATNNEELVKLTVTPKIPDTVTNMMATFVSCNITAMPTIPGNVTILTSTFYDCADLQKTTKIPGSVRDMDYCFRNCTSLTKTPQIENGVVNCKGTFRNCDNLTEVTNLPNSILTLSDAFRECSSLVSLTNLPSNVENLGWTFADCTSLVNGPTVIPGTVKVVRRLFSNCPKLQGEMVINATISEGEQVGGILAYSNCFLDATTETGVSLTVSGDCEALEAIVNTKSSNSNITLKTDN